MKDMTHKQLIRATYVAAKYESAQTAQLLTELAGRLDGALAAARTACLERDASVRAEIEWEKAMMQAVGEDGVGDVVLAIEKLKAGRDALAAENGQMLRLLTDISENHLEYLSEGEDCMMAGVPLDYVSEINMYVSRDIEAENPFKATDAFLAEVRAQARNVLVDELEARFTELTKTLPTELQNGAAGAAGFVSTFRQGAAQ